MSDETTVARIPAGISIDLFGAVGGLLDAALGGALLAAGDAPGVAGNVVLRTEQTERDAVRLLNAARRRIAGRKLVLKAEDEPSDDEPEPMTLNRVTEIEGSVEFGLGGPVEQAREMARGLLDAFIPALRETGAVNYLEFGATDVKTGQRYAVIVVKPDGLTPHEAREEAERECERLRAQLGSQRGGSQ